jgi:DNA-binding NtrC family response regulator
VEKTTGVSEMIRRVRDDDLKVMLIDDQLEGVKAWTLVSLVKEINAKVQIIVISSEQSIESVKRLREAGIFYQAMKPIDAEEIESAVECAFEKIKREHPREGIFSFLIPRLVPA